MNYNDVTYDHIVVHIHVYMLNVVSFDCCCFIPLKILSLISVGEDLPMLSWLRKLVIKQGWFFIGPHVRWHGAFGSRNVTVFRFSSVATGARTPPFACEANVINSTNRAASAIKTTVVTYEHCCNIWRLPLCILKIRQVISIVLTCEDGAHQTERCRPDGHKCYQ